MLHVERMGKAGRFLLIYLKLIIYAQRLKGGPNIDENLQLLCAPCNRRKSNRTMQYLLDILSQKSMGF